LAVLRTVREFSELPPGSGLGTKHVLLRPFSARFCARPGALDVQFHERPRLELELELLSMCCEGEDGVSPGRQALLDLPVSARTESLLALAELSNPRPLEWSFRCGNPSCGSENEFELSFAELAECADRTRLETSAETEVDGIRLQLRRPTGRDQLSWEESGGAPSAEVVLQTLVSAADSGPSNPLERLPLERIATVVDRVMGDFDPLAAFELEAVCPVCGSATKTAVELANAALERLAAEQAELLVEIHLLASHYHWDEEAIVRLPAWRRRFYLQQIDGAGWIS